MDTKKRKIFDLWDEESSKPKKLHPSLKRTKKNPLPHPGQSYNPDPMEHEKFLKKILQKELKDQKKQESIKKALNVTIDPKELQEHEQQELVSGIEHLIKLPANKTKDAKKNDNDSSTDSAYSDYDEKDFEAILKDNVVHEKRKSKRQRLAQLRDRLQRRAAKLRKLKNIRLAKFDGIKKLTKELEKREKEAAAKPKKAHRKTKDQRLGPKFEQSDPIYCLQSELPSTLRQTSCPMDAIVREQLESFQSRLMVEPSKYQIKKCKYKKKQFERKVAEEQEG